MTNKYEMLKKYVNGVADFNKEDNTLKDIQELMNDLDKAEPEEKEEKNLIAKLEFNKMGYKQRVQLSQDDPESYKNAVAGNFKEEK